MKIRIGTLKKLIKEAVMQQSPRQNMRVTKVMSAKDMDFHSDPYYLRALNSFIQLYMDADQRKMHGQNPLSRHDIMYDFNAIDLKFVEVETALGKRFLIAVGTPQARLGDLYDDVNDTWIVSSNNETTWKLKLFAFNHVHGIG